MVCECANLQDLLLACGDIFSLKTYLSAVLESLCDKGCGGILTTAGLNPALNPTAATAEGFPQLRDCECLFLVLQDTIGNIFLSTTKGQSWVMVPTIQNNVTTVDPTVNDDSGDGYFIGSRWINTVDDTEFVCTNASVGAAVWIQTSNVPSGLVWLASGKLLADAPTIDITGIPQTYHDLILVIRGRTTEATASLLRLRFNGDSGNNYSDVSGVFNGASLSGAVDNNQVYAFLSSLAGAGATAGYFSGIKLTLPDYARTDINKLGHYIGIAFNSPTGIASIEGEIAWEDVSSGINQITLSTIQALGGAANLAAGTSWILYGRGAAL